ncbi:MAG TPA: glycoside hydrolase family 3 C-terminal domain-containing protein [Solirubrobacterales bacterium]|nr:glycoside hydrolase family 3 C-terminal domain-containing protein [Solirubrobacterales bacterium]
MIVRGAGRASRRRRAAAVTSVLAVQVALLALLAAVPTASAAGRCGAHPWCDTSLSAKHRAALLLGALTPAERIGLLGGDEASGIAGAPGTHTGTSDGVPRVDLPTFFQTDGPIGVRSGKATALPGSIALAASFDTSLARRAGALIGNEAKLKGNDLVYAPTVNILRTPLWGRAFESLGEDPYLTARMAVPYIRAMQRQGVIADVKHFAANNQEGRRVGGETIGSRFTVNAEVGERTLREIYLPAFEAAVKDADVGSVMCSYNRLNGPHACANRPLLHGILRRDWGFDGLVLADYAASKTVAGGLGAGLDYEPWPFADTDGGENYTPDVIEAALAAGEINRADINRAVRHILRTLFASGFFDRAGYVPDESAIDKAAHRRTSQRLAEQGAVLLRNRGGALPLGDTKLDSLAVIGADADRYITGGGSSNIDPFTFTSVRDGIAARADRDGIDVSHDSGEDLAQAAAVAAGADAAVVVVADAATEGVDKPCLGLDCGAEPIGGVELDRDALIEAVAAANPETIVVLETAGPVLTPWRGDVDAILEAWYPGMAAGPAVARVLFGDADPSGRLPATFPRREEDLPTAGRPERYPGVDGVVEYSEGVLVGYRWFDRRRIKPAYPFGFGLSYTRFHLGGLKVDRAGRGGVRVSVRVKNRGDRAGHAVPQIYVHLPGAPGRVQPPRQLKAFASVRLRPGNAKRVSFRLDRRAFSFWNSARDGWRVAPGCYRIELGSSSRDIVARESMALRGGSCGRQ